jgi:hypothetical protein
MTGRSLFGFLVWFSLALSGVRAEPLTFNPANPPAQSTPPTEVYHEYTGTNAWRLGPKTMMVFRVYPSDRDPWTSYKSDAALLSELMTMSANYYEGSYHQTWFGPKRRNGMDIPVLVVTPPMQLPGTYEQYRNSFALLQSHSRAAAEALGPEWRNGGIYDHRHYDRHVAMSNANMVGSAGLAYVNGKFSWTGGSLSGTIAVHELGHNWGVYHANSWFAPSGVDPEVHPRSPLRQNGEYQDGWCVMGGGTPSLMFNPLFRYRLGFLTRERNEVKDITSSGTYRIYDYQHHDRRQTESLVRVLNIPITSYTAWNNVFLGFGHRSGTDGGWSRTDYNRNAVTVHSMMSDGSNRLDTTPNSRPGSADRDDSSIKIGRTYSEGPNENGTQMFGGFHVTPVLRGSSEINGQTHEWIEVVINYGNDVVGNQPPTASFSTTVLNGAVPGVPFELTVDASDPDGDDLAFDWNFGDDTYNIVNSASQTKTWSEPGFYLVEVTVSDMKGGLAEAAVWVNVGDVPYREPETPAATLDGLHYTYFEGSFQQLPNFDTLFPVAEGTVDTFSLAPAQRNSNFAMLYTGYLNVTQEDVYTFSIDARDGVRFWIGNQILIENDGVKSTSAVTTGNIALQEGLHEVRLEFFHRTGGEKLEVSWSTLDMPLTPIGASNFNQTDWQKNTPPSVSIVNPLEGETFLVGADLLITAEASDGDGIAAVRFFANGNFLSEATEEPYTSLWENISVGTQELTALAVDNTGRTQLSNVRTIHVESPPPTRSVGINFAGTASFAFPHAPTVVGFADRIGAVYSEPYWNNFTKAEDDANDGIYLNLIDNDGYPTPIDVEWQGHTESNVGKSATDTSTGNGRMLHGYVRFNNNNQDGPWLIARDIPYAQYDVYVYFDYVNDASEDANPQQFRITTPDGSLDLAPPRYGQNSLDRNNGLGDYPNYETWIGFKESTALSVDAPADERLGNYVVFRNLTEDQFRVVVNRGNGSTSGRRFMNGIQIVEVPATEPAIRMTAPESGWALSPETPTIRYMLRLSVEPDSPVTITPETTGNLVALTETLTFTSANWQQPQSVVLHAANASGGERTLTHTVSATGLYSGVTVAPVSVSVASGSGTTYPSGNQAPVFTSLPEVEALTGAAYSYSVAVSDPDGDPVSIRAVTKPGWLTLTDHGDGTATLSGAVPLSELPSVPVVLEAADMFHSTLQSFDIVFERFPAIDIVSPARSAVELPNSETALHIEAAVDGFGHPVTALWSQERGPAAAQFDDPAGLSPRVNFPEAGHYTLLLSADNGKGVSESRIEVFVASPGAQVLNSGLAGYWRMNDPAGSLQLTDSSGNENHAGVTDNGNFQLGVSGYDGTAVRMGGNGNFATAPLGMPQPMTVSLWMMADASPAQRNGALFGFVDGNGNLRGQLRMESGDTRLHFNSNHVNPVGHWRFEKDIPSGTWMHVVLAYDNSSNVNTPQLWVNGEAVEATLLTAPGDFRGTSTMRIGSATSSNTTWSGRMDEFRLYDRIVPPEDVQLLGYPGPVNVAPNIQVSDQITGPSQTIDLGAVVTDDGLPDPPGEFEVLWVQEGGPDDAVIGAETFADSPFTSGPFPALYALRLFADDGGAVVSRTMQVQSEGGDPLAPEITQQPVSLTVTELEEAAFSVSVNANPAPEFQWRKDGTDIPGATQASFVIPSASLSDAGEYSVYTWNDEGNVTSDTVTLTVNPIPPEAPVITQQPQSQSALVTQSATFSVEATGHPAPEFQWRKDGVELSGETGTSLTLTNLTLSDSGAYDVVVSNSEDTVISEPATLTVAEGPTAPTILAHPQGQTVTAGQVLVLTVDATGNPTPTYQWRLDGNPVSGADQATLELSAVSPEDAGSYDVVVSNSEGTVISDIADVEVLFAPVLLAQPQSLTVTVGQSAWFSVVAEANPEPQYQWYFDGAPLPGETGSTLTIAETDFPDAGQYSVQVGNSVDTVTSDPAVLTVNPGPVTITLQRPTVESVFIPEGVGLILETEVSESGGESGQLTLLWEQISGPGTVTWDHTDTQHTAAWFSEQGNYTLRLSAENGVHSETLEISVGVVDPALIGAPQSDPPALPMGDGQPVTINGWGVSTPAPVASLGTAYQATFHDVPTMSSFGSSDESGQGTYIVVRGGATWNFSGGGSVSGSNFNRYRPMGNSGEGPRVEYEDFLTDGRGVGFGRGDMPLYGLRFVNNTGETINTVDVAFRAYVERGSNKTFPFRWAVTPASVQNPGGGNAESDGPLSAAYRRVHPALDLVVPESVPSDGILNAAGTLEDFEWEPGDTLWLLWECPNGSDSPRVPFDYITLTPDYIPTDENIGPLVSAGDAQNISTLETTLLGTVEDDGLPLLPGTVMTEWITVAGPANAVFSDSAALQTEVSFPQTGEYILRLIAFDGEVATASDVTVIVDADESDPYEDWLAENEVDGSADPEDVDEETGLTYNTLYIMGASKNESDIWQGLLRASSPEPDGNGGTGLRFTARAGRRYTLERALDLGNPQWESVGESIVVGEDSEQDFPVSIPQTGRAFYRIRVELE